jgi:predicted ATPase
MARLDQLGPEVKQVAEIGAAIGREFSTSWSRQSASSEEGLDGALQHLVDAGLVFQRGAPPAAEYLFKHALVQDTAYGTLLRGPRQALHGGSRQSSNSAFQTGPLASLRRLPATFPKRNSRIVRRAIG